MSALSGIDIALWDLKGWFYLYSTFGQLDCTHIHDYPSERTMSRPILD